MISKKGRKKRDKEAAECLLTAPIAFSILHEESGSLNTFSEVIDNVSKYSDLLHKSRFSDEKHGKNIKLKRACFQNLLIFVQFMLLNRTMFSESFMMTSHRTIAVNLLVNP